jgi:hypothetical protein
VLKIGHNQQKRKSHISIAIEMCNYPSFALCFAREFTCSQLYIYIIKNFEIIDYGYSRKQKKKNPFILKEKVKSWAN